MGLPENSGLEPHFKFPCGKKNKITDVPGVRVANVTHKGGSIHTGVTAVLPHQGSLFREKVPAGAAVINGFGKSLGLIQIEELGTIETPVLMTNTFSVGTAATALVKYMLERNEDIGVTTCTVNPVVTECNDGELNDIRGFHVTEEDVFEALRRAEEKGGDFEEGAVGGGTGMCCLGFKGGIGSASRLVTLDEKEYTVGALVMTNFGDENHLIAGGRHIGEEAAAAGFISENTIEGDSGSIIILLASDIPLSSRQLSRLARRAPIALGRTGSYMGHGSGDICIAFSVAGRVPHYSDKDILPMRMLHEDAMDRVFEPAEEAIEDAILSALWHAETTVGVRGKKVYGLRDFLEYQKK